MSMRSRCANQFLSLLLSSSKTFICGCGCIEVPVSGICQNFCQVVQVIRFNPYRRVLLAIYHFGLKSTNQISQLMGTGEAPNAS
jgi:hypothetical protein